MPKNSPRRYLLAIYWILSILPFIVTYAFYPYIQDRIAIHFGLSGVANGWANKSMIAAFPVIFFVVACGIQLINRYALKYSTTSDRDKTVARKYLLVAMIVVLLVFNVITASVIVVNAPALPLHPAFDGSSVFKLVFALIGILLLLSGVYGVFFSDRTKQNRFIGARVPWELDDRSWLSLQRFSGRNSIVAGLVELVACGIVLPLEQSALVTIAIGSLMAVATLLRGRSLRVRSE
ncbi:protein of unknown function DUF1648 [Coriobacterium glomerans PW2]|uniref:DUF1648 domain-containing protein n=1 Tax=Coriobacterium glomerans (strain ATCC 49209 / DSM 20642 / JCM 10262 / PW2) TaxID=700015 RepID=F2N9K8_CORGP|nr:DUF1648 domain-containing protein [Coriobacterium glomerans]AEB07037.1 protein of unknown function DUF1648 [Coriobacterium glomerans PW2]